MEKGRVEAFSDGVIAIAITLLVLDIHVPEPLDGGRELGLELGRQWPSYAAYVVSFVTIGIIWINHHATLLRLRAVNHTLLLYNLVLLLFIGLLPWSTALMAAYLREEHGNRLAAVIYAGSFLLMTASFYAMGRYILFGEHELAVESIQDSDRRTIDLRNRVGILPYLIAAVAGLFSAYVTLAICALIAVYYALPRTTYGTGRWRRSHRHPDGG